MLDVDVAKRPLGLPKEKAFEDIERALSEHESVAVVLSGDPLFYGLGEEIKRRFPFAQILPSVSYMQLCFSKVGKSWDKARFSSVHGRRLDYLLFELSQAEELLFVYTDKNNTPSKIAKILLNQGVTGIKKVLGV